MSICGSGITVSATYWWSSLTAIEPSLTTEATRLTELLRTLPAANTPGKLVSRRYSYRESPRHTFSSSAERSSALSVRMKLRSSSSTASSSQPVLASAPMKSSMAIIAPKRCSPSSLSYRRPAMIDGLYRRVSWSTPIVGARLAVFRGFCSLRTAGRWLGDRGLHRSLARAGTDPEDDKEAPDEARGDVEQAGLRAEDAAGKEERPALLSGENRSAHGFEAAHREAEDVALEEVPGDVQPNGDGEPPREDVSDSQKEPREGYVDGANGRGVRIAQVPESEEGGRDRPRQDHRHLRSSEAREVQALGKVRELVTAREQLFGDAHAQEERERHQYGGKELPATGRLERANDRYPPGSQLHEKDARHQQSAQRETKAEVQPPISV